MGEAHFGSEAGIERFDATGKRVLAQVVSAVADNLVVELPACLRDGFYLVMLRMEGHSPKSARVIVRR